MILSAGNIILGRRVEVMESNFRQRLFRQDNQNNGNLVKPAQTTHGSLAETLAPT